MTSENTLAALAAAIAAGCDGMELDVRLSRDGQAIVLHDASFLRPGRVAAPAAARSAAQLAAHGVPRLAEMLAAAPKSFLFDVEIKDGAAVEATIAVVEAARGQDAAGVVISSFDEDTLIDVGARRPDWRRWLISRDAAAVERAAALGCTGVALAVAALDADVVAGAHDAGLSVMAWTVADAAMQERLIRMGVDVLCVQGEAVPG